MCAYLNDLGMASRSTSDMLVTTTMAVNCMQKIVVATSMSEVQPKPFLGHFQCTYVHTKPARLQKSAVATGPLAFLL